MTLIEALRCSAGTMSDCKPDCPYRTREVLGERLRSIADYVEGGVPYCVGCDAEQIALDAAAELERLQKGR